METKSRIIKKDSTGYGYKYASLADIVAQGYEIPKTRVVVEEGRDFIYFYDPEFKEWLRGAEIIIPEMKNANKAQLYGSALTYALRYSTILYNRLATSEDSIIVEDIDDKGESKSRKGNHTKETTAEMDAGQIAELRAKVFPADQPKLKKAEKEWIIKHNNLVSENDITDEMIATLRALQEEKRNANK